MPKADIIFECSYEVCNKVGGIYTVIRSKAAEMKRHYSDGYYTIGFYQPDKALIEFEDVKPPKELEIVFEKLGKEGIECHYGTWLIPGKPKTILINSQGYLSHINYIKTWLWDEYQVDSIKADDWFNHPVVWAYCVGKLLEEIEASKFLKGKKIVGHFHEWMSGCPILYLKSKKSKIKTVFTTHATMLGRTIAGSGGELYDMVNEGLREGKSVDSNKAKSFNVEDKHSMEISCARNADVFTTVSQITGKEAEFLLGRKPDVYLFNGVDCNKYPELEELSVLRRKYRQETRHFLTAYFSRYYNLDFMKIRSVYLSGRYEFHNKGMDVFIDALGKLNKQMKSNGYDNTIIAFIFVPAGTNGENIEVLKNVSLFEELYDHVEEYLPDVKYKIVTSLTEGELPKDVFDENFKQHSKKIIAHFKEKKGQSPPLSAFELQQGDGDQVIQALKKNELLNREEDKVKVIFYPAYLSSADRFIGLEYNEATLTCDMGVFPSFYEPWGYTPLESAAQATPSITTDLAGYGQFMEGKGDGIKVLKVEDRGYWDIVEDLYHELLELAIMPKKELTERRINAKSLSYLADWSMLSENYVKAHDLAIKKK